MLSLNRKPKLEDLNKGDLIEFIRKRGLEPSTDDLAFLIWQRATKRVGDDLKTLSEKERSVDLEKPGAFDEWKRLQTQITRAMDAAQNANEYFDKWVRGEKPVA